MRALASALLSLSLAAGAPAPAPNATPAPVVLELFTSEGCSSCPPADELLLRLEGEPGVIALGFHVDYWDGLGWKDPFSSAAFTQRQFAYARALGQTSAYTPELVVDGRTGFVGSSAADADHALAQARARTKVPVKIEDGGGELRVSLEAPSGRRLDVLLAMTESGLQSDVLRGENRGRRLRHASVVRQLSKVGSLEGRGGPQTLVVAVDPRWRSRHERAVILLQDPLTLEIVGAQTFGF